MDNFEGQWFIVYTKTNCEASAKNSLSCEALVPMVQEVVTKRGKVRTQLKPRYRNYLYVRHTGESNFFERVLMNEYVSRFVSKHPVSAPDMEEVIEKQTPKNMLKANQEVEVVDGSFLGMRGTIRSKSDEGNYLVEFNVLDHKITEQIPKEFLISHGD